MDLPRKFELVEGGRLAVHDFLDSRSLAPEILPID
jgi:hypothetical protein